MPNSDILDILKASQDHPDISRIDAIGAFTIQRTIGEFFDPTKGAIGLSPRNIQKNPACFVRSSEFPQFLDLPQC
jgi:hypothetical protein